MGQKVNPYGFRLGVTTDWKSRWFSERDYKDYLTQDWKIRRYLMRELESAAVSRVCLGTTLRANTAYFTSGCGAGGAGFWTTGGFCRAWRTTYTATRPSTAEARAFMASSVRGSDGGGMFRAHRLNRT